MLKRWIVPEAWGGGEAEEVPQSGCDFAIPEGYAALARGSRLPVAVVHRNALTPVAPPIPEEPSPGAYEIGNTLAVREVTDDPTPWLLPMMPRHSERWLDWEGVWKLLGGPDVQIKGAVFLDKVKLPWTGRTGQGSDVSVHLDDSSYMRILVGSTFLIALNGKYGREMAAALLTATGDLG